MEVLYTVIQSLTADGRERGLDYKLSGFHVPPGCWDAQVGGTLSGGALSGCWVAGVCGQGLTTSWALTCHLGAQVG